MHAVTRVTPQKRFNHKALNKGWVRPFHRSTRNRISPALLHPRSRLRGAAANQYVLATKGRRVMAGVVFIFVREDASEVEMLAEAFDEAGYAITGTDNAELSVIVWSRRALRSDCFRVAAERALRSGKAVVAAIFAPPPREAVFDAPVIDLSRWDGVDEAALAPLLRAADDIVHPIEAHVIVLPADPAYDVAPRAAPLLIASEESAPPAEPKLGAPAPRRDFRRIGARRSREHAALAFFLIAMVSGGAFVVSVAEQRVPCASGTRAVRAGRRRQPDLRQQRRDWSGRHCSRSASASWPPRRGAALGGAPRGVRAVTKSAEVALRA
jgi:hypothetical protein